MVSSSRIAVLGPGPLGALLARLAAAGGLDVAWWAGPQAAVLERRRRRRGPRDPGPDLPPGVRRVADPAAALDGAGLVFLALPAGELLPVVADLGPSLSPDRLVVHAAKGLTAEEGRRPSELIAAETPARRLGALGGPYLVSEVLEGYVASVVTASRFDEVNEAVRSALASPSLHVETTHDLAGVELAGAAVVALGAAAGLAAGLGLGSGARSVLLARGLAEATRLGTALGARSDTFGGPAGVADLLVTAAVPEGLGYRFGRRVGSGEPAAEVRRDVAERTEALAALDGLCVLGRRARVALPTLDAVRDVLVGDADPRATVDGLLRVAT